MIETETPETAPDEGAVLMVECPECHRSIRPQALLRHRQSMHGFGTHNAPATPIDAEWGWRRFYEWLVDHPGSTQADIRDATGMTIKACSNRVQYLTYQKEVTRRDEDGRYWPLTREDGQPYTVADIESKPLHPRFRSKKTQPNASGSMAYKDRRDQCPECGNLYKAADLKRHRRNVHGLDIPPGPPGRPARPKPAMPAFAATNGQAAVPALVPHIEALDRDDVSVTDIVETIVSLRFPDQVPTNLLPQVLELESVIRRFLEPA